MEQVGLGVVGLGWFGGVLADAVGPIEGADVVACFARSEASREAFAAAHGGEPVGSLDELLGDSQIRGVILATPHSTHVDLVQAIAAAGKHVFVEKPLALTADGARRAIAAAAAAGVTLQIGHNRRRQPANRRIKAMIEGGDLGTVMQLEGFHSSPGAHRPDLPAWRTDPEECPAGGMTALGVHTVDTFHYLVGPAKRLTALSKQLLGVTALDEATSVTIEYASGPIGHIGTSYFVPPVVWTAVYGTERNVWSEDDGARFLEQARADANRSERPVDTLDTIADELQEFVACIKGEAEPETGPEAGLEVALVLDAIVESLATGSAVDLAGARSEGT
jgi:predicted dehydrogenase